MKPALPLDCWGQGNRVALEFSGGRDSLACLYLLRDHLDELTVYWLDSGDNFPETYAMMEELKGWVPNFVTVRGNSPAVRNDYGWPVDAVPCTANGMGLLVDSPIVAMQSRYDCCGRAIMLPLHERVTADGCNVIIRGQRSSDTPKSPIEHGEQRDDITFLYPIDTWTDKDVMEYLELVEAPVPRYYQFGLTSAPDCMGCTGWLEERRGSYLKRFHPEAYEQYQHSLRVIASELHPHVSRLAEEINDDSR